MPRKKSEEPTLFPLPTTPPQSGPATQFTRPPTLSDLIPANTLVPTFEAIRGFMAANAHGITRDDAILEELSKLLHAKVYDETCAARGAPVRFFGLQSEPDEVAEGRVQRLYAESLEGQINGGSPKTIGLDTRSLLFAVRALQGLRLAHGGRDVIGEAYESLIFPALRGGQGQFFTPKNVGACLVELVGLSHGERVIDPACGPGGFLAESAAAAARAGVEVTLHGIDKDDLLVRLASDSLRARGLPAEIACGNSLLPFESLPKPARAILRPGHFDVVVTNPPFGAKIPVSGVDVLSQFELARKWVFSSKTDSWVATNQVRDALPPQVLFIERCWQLLREGGRCGIVLPEGVLGNQSLGYIRRWLIDRADILAVVDCPLETFMPSTSTKTVLLVFQRRRTPVRPPVFMAVAEQCGHDRRGQPVVAADGSPEDDFPRIARAWKDQCREVGR